jgi:hypothetical protein
LLDFSWVEQRKILIAHDDIPLQNDIKSCETYLGILKFVVDVWKRKGHLRRDLAVCFPRATKERITNALYFEDLWDRTLRDGEH